MLREDQDAKQKFVMELEYEKTGNSRLYLPIQYGQTKPFQTFNRKYNLVTLNKQ